MNRTAPVATAATVPIAMRSLADHIIDRKLPGPAAVNIPGTIVSEADVPEVTILLDRRSVLAWIGSLDSPGDHTVNPHPGRGWWHDLTGTASSIRVRLSWWVSLDHQTCEGGCGDTICRCGNDDLCPRTVEQACTHGRDLCHADMSQCSECVDDRRQDRAEGWGR